jgi:hypothetical protein
VIWAAHSSFVEYRGSCSVYLIDRESVWLLGSTFLEDVKVYEIQKSSSESIHRIVAAFTWDVFIRSKTTNYIWWPFSDRSFNDSMFQVLGELEVRGLLKDNLLLERIVVGLDDMISELIEINFLLRCDWLRFQAVHAEVKTFLLDAINIQVISDRDVYLHEDVFVTGYQRLNQESRVQVWKMIGVLLYDYYEI